MAGERAINMALRVVGIGEVEREFKRVGQAGEQSFDRIEKSANGADRAVSDYTARLRRAVTEAKMLFDSTPGVAEARLVDPRGYLEARNQAILGVVEREKARIAAGLPDLTQGLGDAAGAADGMGMSLTRLTAIGAAAGLAFVALKNLVVASAQAFIEHAEAIDAFEAELSLGGNRTAMTARQIEDLASSIRDSSLQTEEAALRAGAALAKVPELSQAAFTEAMEAAAAYADVSKREVADVIEQDVAPVFMALAERDMKALIEATSGLNDKLANTIVHLAETGNTAGAQQALIDGLREATGDGPNGLTKATNDLDKAWTRLKEGLGEDIASVVAPMLTTIADSLDWVRDRAEALGVTWLGMVRRIVSVRFGIPIGALGGGEDLGPGNGLLPSETSNQFMGQFRLTADAASEWAERKRLEELYGSDRPKPKPSGRGGGNDAAREAERLQREADRAREAADRVIAANDEVLASYERRAAEAEGRIGLEGEALAAYDRQIEIDTTVRRLNRAEIEKVVEARRAEAAAAGEQFDEAAATAAATAALEAKSGVLRRHAETIADANAEQAEFNRRQAEARSLIAATRTPLEELNDEIDRAIELLRSGDITAETFERRMDQIAEGIARVSYEADEGARAWRGFGDEVTRSLADIALEGGSAREVLRELLRLPLERMLQQGLDPLGRAIDGLTGNDRDERFADARAGLPGAAEVLGASVRMIEPAAEGAAGSLSDVQVQGAGAAQALAQVAALGPAGSNPIAGLGDETARATEAMAGMTPTVSSLGATIAQAVGLIGGGGGGGGLFGAVVGLAGSLFGGGASPANFASGTESVPVGRWFNVGENGRETMRYHGDGRLEVASYQQSSRGSGGGGTTIYDLRGAVVYEDLFRQIHGIARQHAEGAVATYDQVAADRVQDHLERRRL